MSVGGQTSITLFNQTRTPASNATRTAIVFGINRGGTSMVAGVVRGHGYYFGPDLAVNNEDADFSYRSVEEMRASISQRDREHGLWGWKFPMAADYLDNLLTSVRNPLLIIVNRDIVATSLGLLRWDDRQASAALSEAIGQNQKNLALALRWELPTLLVSYEKAIVAPDIFLQEMSTFLGTPLAVDHAAMVRFMAAGSYKGYDDVVFI